MPSSVILPVFLSWFRQMLCLFHIELEVALMKTTAWCKIISVKQYWAKYWTLGDTTGDRPPIRPCATDYEPLGSAVQPVVNSLSAYPLHISWIYLWGYSCYFGRLGWYSLSSSPQASLLITTTFQRWLWVPCLWYLSALSALTDASCQGPSGLADVKSLTQYSMTKKKSSFQCSLPFSPG